jgi:DNA polymerase delta subunit 2
MAGELDITSAMMPQQPINCAMFPNLIKPERVNFVTNPHSFFINGISFLGTSGQNIKDIRMYAESHKNPVDIMEKNLA